MSRAFTLEAKALQPEDVLRDSISSMDADVINEVVLDAASREEANTPELRKRRLESIEFQNEMIEDERDDTEAAKQSSATAGASSALDADKQAQIQDALRMQAEMKHMQEMMAPAPPATITGPSVSAAEMAMRDLASGDRRIDPFTIRASLEALAPSMPKTEPTNEQQKAALPSPATTATPAAGPTVTTTTSSVVVVPSTTSTTSASSTTPATTASKPQLTLAEMQAIGELAQSSSVEAERVQLAMMKAMMHDSRIGKDSGEVDDINLAESAAAASHMELSPEELARLQDDLALADISEELRQDVLALETMVAEKEKLTEQTAKLQQQVVKAEEEDTNVARMRKMLVSMLNKLESRIEKAESAIGDKLRLLDKDQDGVLDAHELREVVHHVLKRHTTEADAQAVVQMLDKDSDGKVSVQEIMDWVEVTKAKAEIEAYEERLRQRREKIRENAKKVAQAQVQQQQTTAQQQQQQQQAPKDVSS